MITAILGNNQDDKIQAAATESTSAVSVPAQTTEAVTEATEKDASAAPETTTVTETTAFTAETEAPETTAATELPTEEAQITEEADEADIAAEAADTAEQTSDEASADTAPAPFFDDIYIFNSASPDAPGQVFTLHASGTYDYFTADYFVHARDEERSMGFTARCTDTDTPFASGSIYDYITVSVVPYYNDGTCGDTVTVRYELTQE